MKSRKRLTWFSVLFTCLAVHASAVTDTIVYTYDDNQQVIRVNYNDATIVDYVYDGMGNRLSCSTSTSGMPANNPPIPPDGPLPANGSTNVIAATALSWTAGDPDPDDQVVYDLYLGTAGNPPLYQEGLATASFQPARLLPLTTYYWKIKARDNHNVAAESPVWSFTTGNEAPSAPVAVFPLAGGIVAYNNAYLSWQGIDSDIGDFLTYDIYFGTSTAPPLIKNDHPASTYDLGALTPGTTYYWKIMAKDAHGGSISGEVWSFTTAAHASVFLNSAITTNTTLAAANGPYIVGNGFSVQSGATLTIEPGTIIKVQIGADLLIWGKIIAEGNSDNPIIITSERDDSYGGDTNGDGALTLPARGDWVTLNLQNGQDASRLTYVKILYGGGNGYYGALYCGGGSTSIDHCTIANSGSHGIRITTGSQNITNTIFTNNQNYDIHIGNCSGAITGNSISSGIYVGNNALGSLSSNTIVYNNGYPVRLHPDDIGRLLTNNTVLNVDEGSYLEVNGGNISRDAVWTALMPYHILYNITVQGSDGEDAVTTLTIQPSAKLLFEQNMQITIGASSGAPGALIARGSLNDPIQFIHSSFVYGNNNWRGIYFENTTHDATSILEYCAIEYAGIVNGYGVSITNASPTISHCTIRYSQGSGIYVWSGAPVINGNNITNCASYGINAGGTPGISNNTFAANGNFDVYISIGTNVTLNANTIRNGFCVQSGVLGGFSGNNITYNDNYPIRVNADDVGRLLANNTITNVTANSFLEVTGGTVSKDATWTDLMTYRILGLITVQGTDGGDAVTTLTIQPGAKLLFNPNTRLTIGASSGAPGALNAQGTSVNPVLFTSGKTPQTAGDWYGIEFKNTAHDGGAILDYCIVEYAGLSYAIVDIDQASPVIAHAAIRYSLSTGIRVWSGAPVISGNSITNCASYGINAGGTPNISNNIFTANGNFDVYISIGTNITLNGNTIQKGLYVQSGVLGIFSGNNITYNDNYPVRVNADDVGRLLANNTITNVTSTSFLEVTTGTVSKDAAWSNLMAYRILGSITVQGADGGDAVTTLTIQPGAKLLFNPNTRLTVGANSGTPGALNAQGTSAEPILFTSGKTPQAAGDWYGIEFKNTTYDATTIMDYCIVEYAGLSYGAIYIDQASPTIRNTIVSNSKTSGIYVYNGSPVIQNCQFIGNVNYDLYYTGAVGGSVTGCTINSGIYFGGSGSINFSGNTVNYNNSRPMRLTADNVGSFLNTGTILNTTPDSYLEVTGGTITKDATWSNLLIYRILGSITVQGADGGDAVTTLTIQPGAKLLFNQATQLIIGAYSGAPGALNAQGTSANPILFTSGKTPQAAGDWYGIAFNNTTYDAGTILDYCLVEYAGLSSYVALSINQASPTIRNTIESNSNSYGVYISNGSPIIQSCQFIANANYDLYYSGTVGGSVQDCTINKGIYLLATGSVALSGTTVNYNNAYPIKVYADNVGALLSGTTLLNLDANSYLSVNSGYNISHDAVWTAAIPYYIQGNITVQGTDGGDAVTTLTIQPGAQLLFYQYTSLTIGNSSGAPGALIAQGTLEEPIWFTSSKATPAPGDWYGIYFSNTTDDSTTIMEYCNVEYGGYNNQGGIYIWDANPILRYNNITNNKYGIYVYSGNPVITNNNIFNNTGYGLYKYTAAILTAQDNWWGDATGPYHPTANPAGTGNAVGNYVNFTPWLTE